MLIQIVHIFYYHVRLHGLDVEFYEKKSRILEFFAFEFISFIRLQMALHNI